MVCVSLFLSLCLSVCDCAVLRDLERGRKLDYTLTTYMKFVKPAFEEFVLPVGLFVYVSHVMSRRRNSLTSSFHVALRTLVSDFVPAHLQHAVAIDLIVHHLRLVSGDLALATTTTDAQPLHKFE